MAPKTWIITGCGSIGGFGDLTAREALSRDEKVIATSRNGASLGELAALGATTISLDVCADDETVNSVIKDALEKAGSPGKIDIVVNNAGYLLEGPVEACSAEEVQTQFDVNVFGPLRVMRAVLPYMRAQKSGIIANIGSIGGWAGTPVAGLYCGAKFALAGLTDTLRMEVESMGIEVTIIEPGYFRTNFLTNQYRTRTVNKIPDYAIADQMSTVFDSVSHKQPGDPVKGARVIVDCLTKSGAWAECEKLPWRIALGNDATEYIRNTLKGLTDQHEKWAPVVKVTDWVEESAH